MHRYGERAVLEEGFQVYTTLNVEYQKAAQLAVSAGLHDLDERQGYREPLAQLLSKEIVSNFERLIEWTWTGRRSAPRAGPFERIPRSGYGICLQRAASQN